MNITSVITQGASMIGKACVNNLPVIQTAFSIIGTIVTPIWTAKATARAKDIIADERAKRGPDSIISKGEMVELTWREFVGPVLLCGATCACEIKTTKDLIGKAAATTAVAATSAKALQDYTDKNKELFGNTNDQKIKRALTQDMISEYRASGIPFPETHSPEEHVFYDPFSGRLFVTTINKFRAAVLTINESLIVKDSWAHERQMQLNDFYSELGDPVRLGVLQAGYNVGWNTNNPLKYDITWEEYDGDKVIGKVSYNLFDLGSNTPILSV